MYGHNVLWFRTFADEFYWNLVNKMYGTAGFGKISNVVEVQKVKIPEAVVADRLAKNVKLSAYALSLQKVPYVFCLQPTLAVTKKSLTPYEAQWPNITKDYFNNCYKEIDRRLSHLDMDNFTYVNLSGIFDKESRDEHIFLDSYHFGDKGNKIIAGHIYQSIKNMVASSRLTEVGRQ